jgi:glycerate kinase
MRVVIAPDKFKGSLSASEAAEAMARGVGRVAPGATIDRVPMADGGEGTVAALVAATWASPSATSRAPAPPEVWAAAWSPSRTAGSSRGSTW